MTSVFGIAMSGLYAASKKFEVSAQNVANIFSTKVVKDGQTINEPYHAQQANAISNSLGGVVKVNVSDANPPTKTIFNPNAENADANGASLVPNVELENELITQQMASHYYKANLKAIQTQINLDKSLLDIKS